jgi:hypothetical protein
MIVGLGVAVGWWILHPRPVFVVLIRNGTARVSRGKVPRAFLAEVSDECRRSGLSNGVVKGVRRGPRLSLAFSRSIPEECRQRLRNVWQLTG